MDAGVRSPLIDFFRRGEVASDVRLLAAQGALAPRALEQLALLLFLVDDPDPVVARTAAATIDLLPGPAVASFLARRDVPQAMRDFFAARGIATEDASPAPDAEDAPLFEAPAAEESEERD
jgi:hypothetical protein